ncbi:MAG: hypothetical protein ACXAB7_01525 [Candidatus Kariarchaeaceae archaeon]|jgi:hypothetical protein
MMFFPYGDTSDVFVLSGDRRREFFKLLQSPKYGLIDTLLYEHEGKHRWWTLSALSEMRKRSKDTIRLQLAQLRALGVINSTSIDKVPGVVKGGYNVMSDLFGEKQRSKKEVVTKRRIAKVRHHSLLIEWHPTLGMTHHITSSLTNDPNLHPLFKLLGSQKVIPFLENIQHEDFYPNDMDVRIKGSLLKQLCELTLFQSMDSSKSNSGILERRIDENRKFQYSLRVGRVILHLQSSIQSNPLRLKYHLFKPKKENLSGISYRFSRSIREDGVITATSTT